MASEIVLDSEAVSALAARHERGVANARAKAILAAVDRRNATINIPAAVLAEVYRGTGRDAGIDRLVRRGRMIVNLDHWVARLAGALLGRDGLDSCHTVDASVVATAIRLGGATVITGDSDDLRSLAREHPNVVVEAL